MERLKKLATRMKELALQEPEKIVRYSPGGTLRLAIRWKPLDVGAAGVWYLGMWRKQVAPNGREVEVIRGAFGVSEDAGCSGKLELGEWIGLYYVWADIVEGEPAAP